MWEIPYLMLRASATIPLLHVATFPYAMSRLATGVVGHPRLIAGLLASTCVIFMMVVHGRPLIHTWRVKFFLLISLSLDSVAIH